MKIFVVEDEAASIESAKIQLGSNHKLVFFTTAMEVAEELDRMVYKKRYRRPDLILTDVNIPMGESGTLYSVKDYYSPNDMIPAGLVVALRAATARIPCSIVTDSNSHQDVIGLLLDKAEPRLSGKVPQMVDISTRPNRIDTPVGRGKDWLGYIQYRGGIEKFIKFLTAVHT